MEQTVTLMKLFHVEKITYMSTSVIITAIGIFFIIDTLSRRNRKMAPRKNRAAPNSPTYSEVLNKIFFQAVKKVKLGTDF